MCVCELGSFWRSICHLAANISSNYTLQRYNDNFPSPPPSHYPQCLPLTTPLHLWVQLRFVFMQIARALIDSHAQILAQFGSTCTMGKGEGKRSFETGNWSLWLARSAAIAIVVQARGWLRSFVGNLFMVCHSTRPLETLWEIVGAEEKEEQLQREAILLIMLALAYPVSVKSAWYLDMFQAFIWNII